jgi:hypothetical protein
MSGRGADAAKGAAVPDQTRFMADAVRACENALQRLAQMDGPPNVPRRGHSAKSEMLQEGTRMRRGVFRLGDADLHADVYGVPLSLRRSASGTTSEPRAAGSPRRSTSAAERAPRPRRDTLTVCGREASPHWLIQNGCSSSSSSSGGGLSL